MSEDHGLEKFLEARNKRLAIKSRASGTSAPGAPQKPEEEPYDHGLSAFLAARNKRLEAQKRASTDSDRCGTSAAYQRHLKAGEPIDEVCREAHNAYQRESYRLRNPKKPLQPCGTWAAYQRHLRKEEEPCRPCKDAANARVNEWRRKKKNELPNL